MVIYKIEVSKIEDEKYVNKIFEIEVPSENIIWCNDKNFIALQIIKKIEPILFQELIKDYAINENFLITLNEGGD